MPTRWAGRRVDVPMHAMPSRSSLPPAGAGHGAEGANSGHAEGANSGHAGGASTGRAQGASAGRAHGVSTGHAQSASDVRCQGTCAVRSSGPSTYGPALTALAALLLATAAQAQGIEAQALREARDQALPLTDTRPLPSSEPSATGQVQRWQRTMVWAGGERHRIGLGLASLQPVLPQGPLARQRGADTTALQGTQRVPMRPAMALVAIGRPLAPGVAVAMDLGLPLAGTEAEGIHPLQASRDGASRGELGMGLSFSTRSATADLRQTLSLRMALGTGTAVTLRPRGGRVTVQLNSQW